MLLTVCGFARSLYLKKNIGQIIQYSPPPYTNGQFTFYVSPQQILMYLLPWMNLRVNIVSTVQYMCTASVGIQTSSSRCHMHGLSLISAHSLNNANYCEFSKITLRIFKLLFADLAIINGYICICCSEYMCTESKPFGQTAQTPSNWSVHERIENVVQRSRYLYELGVVNPGIKSSIVINLIQIRPILIFF